MSKNLNGMMMTSVRNRGSAESAPRKRYRLTQYFVSAGVGVIAGGLGVTIVLACIIGIQLFYVTNHMFLPDPTVAAVAAALIGVVIAWLLHLVFRYFSPLRLLQTLNHEGLRVVLIFSVLTSLSETFFFMQNIFTGIATSLPYAWV
ncbi:MAG: hypothetical protein KDI79_25855 [Anaerolineae bacterium]|nr:hypothetical protein [Anaerolineae bacterium]